MTNYREILRLHSLGLNKTEIASSCQCARNTVAATLQRAANCGLQWPLPEEMSDKQLSERLFPTSPSKPVYKMPDYVYVHKELQRSGITLNLLWLEYCDQCRAAGEIPYQSTQFNKYYTDYLTKVNATMHLNHKPGEVMQVDWAGDTAAVIDTDTGEIIPAYVFVATLPYSGYSYVEAFFSMNQDSWTTAHVNAYKYFGGVTRIIQCDNLKTGVQKHGKDEVVLNKSYQELAEHYGTAILPARVRAPKDKAAVEGTVGIISTFILAELAIWKVATVGPNYHISVERMNYSVPFEYIKQKVDVRLTRSTVEVFYGGNRICSHPRLYGRFNQYSTIQEHMPPEHQKYVQWNGERFIHWAGKVGSNTQVVVRAILGSYKVEQQGYKSCMGLLKLADKYTPERLENACKRALEYTPRPSLKNIQAILASGQDKAIPEQSTATASSSQYGFTRGADYYGRGNK